MDAVAVSVPPEAAGSVPPHNLEAETSVLGAILLAEQALDGVLIDVKLRPEDFYRERHRLIFRAMMRLKEKTVPEPVDALTVSEELTRSGELEEAGGTAYVHSLPNLVPAAGNARHYAKIVKEHALLRRLLDTTREIQEKALAVKGEPSELVEQAEQAMYKIAHDEHASEIRSIEAVLHDELDKLEQISREGVSLLGHAVRLPRPRRHHGRLPARQPDRAGRATGDGEERPRRQHRRERGGRPRQGGRAVLARDVGDASSPSASSPRRRSSTATSCARAGSSRTAGRRSSARPSSSRARTLFIDDSSDLGVLELRAKAGGCTAATTSG